MKVKTIACLITLGPMTTVSKTVRPWEAEVLKEKFGGMCDTSDGEAAEMSELPEVESEFSRLQDAHGVDEATKVSHVENTFGRGKAGLKELERTIKGSVVKAKKKPGPKKADAPKADGETEDPLT